MNYGTYIHTDTVKAICPHGDYRPWGHNYILLMGYLSLSLLGCVFCRFQNMELLHEFYKKICANGMGA